MKYYKYKMKIVTLNVLAFITMILALGFYYMIFKEYEMLDMFIIYFILWMFLHEIIHGLTFMSFKEVNAKNVVFGAKLESGIFYCMCKQPISKKIIMCSLLSPLILIGIITLIIAIIFDLKMLGLLSFLNISGAVGDIVMTLMFLKLPKDIQYTDLDDCESFVVLTKENLEHKDYFGLKLVEYGNYTNDIVPKDFQRIKCSRTSMILLIIILALFILTLI